MSVRCCLSQSLHASAFLLPWPKRSCQTPESWRPTGEPSSRYKEKSALGRMVMHWFFVILGLERKSAPVSAVRRFTAGLPCSGDSDSASRLWNDAVACQKRTMKTLRPQRFLSCTGSRWMVGQKRARIRLRRSQSPSALGSLGSLSLRGSKGIRVIGMQCLNRAAVQRKACFCILVLSFCSTSGRRRSEAKRALTASKSRS